FSEELSKILVYHDLEILKINYITLNAASIIIENNGRHLKKILQSYNRTFENNFEEGSLIFICKIYENCPLIEYLSLSFSPSKKHFTEFEKLLKVCQNLKSLLLVIYNFDKEETYEKISENGKELLKALTR